MPYHLSHLELPVAESGKKIARLSERCQELERECKRLVADVNARVKDAGECLLESSCALVAGDREVMCASFGEKSRRLEGELQ